MEQAEINEIYGEISKLPIELAPDPTVLGPLYINETISKCRNHLNRVSQILLRMSRERREVKFKLAGEETLLSAEKDRLLAEDDDVRRAANIRDREAIANTKLRERLNRIHTLKSELLDLDTVEKAVKLIHEELVRTSNEIKTQRSLLHADRITGAAYGDESNLPRDSKGRALPPREVEIDIAELDALVAEGIEEQKAPATQPESELETAPEPVEEAPTSDPVVEVQVEAPVLEIQVQVLDAEAKAETQGTEDDGDSIAKFLSDAPEPTPEPIKEIKQEKVSTKPKDPDEEYLEGLLANI